MPVINIHPPKIHLAPNCSARYPIKRHHYVCIFIYTYSLPPILDKKQRLDMRVPNISLTFAWWYIHRKMRLTHNLQLLDPNQNRSAIHNWNDRFQFSIDYSSTSVLFDALFFSTGHASTDLFNELCGAT